MGNMTGIAVTDSPRVAKYGIEFLQAARSYHFRQGNPSL
jgi:hypothetical protein